MNSSASPLPGPPRPVAVVGLMAVGKTTLATAIAARTGRPLRDSDADLERAHGRTGRQIAAEEGVGVLHELEVLHLLEAVTNPESVIAVAGYAVEDERAIRALRDVDVMWLDAPIAELAARVSPDDHRRQTDGLVAALTEQRAVRGPAFSAVANLVLDATHEPSALIEQALAWLADAPAAPT